MALNYGTKWAIYMLLAKHKGVKGLQSQFATTVAKFVAMGMTNEAAVVKATQEQLDPRVQTGDILTLQTLTADDLRPALGLAAFYDSTQGDCPNGSGDVAKRVDHQKAIANALVAMTGPVPTP